MKRPPMTQAEIDRLVAEFRADCIARRDRVLARLALLTDADKADRVRRALHYIALSEAALVAIGESGRRRSRRERAANDRLTELLLRLETVRSHDILDLELYLAMHLPADAEGAIDEHTLAQLVAVTSRGSA